MPFWDSVAAVAGAALPLFDIPLIARIIKRRSSKDISIFWIAGLWASSAAMVPAALVGHELASKAFNIVNIIMLTAVLIVVIKYRRT